MYLLVFLFRKLWVPDAFFKKSLHSEKPKAILLNISDERFFAKMNPKNNASMVLHYASRVLLKTRCNMKFDDFPFDTQNCQVSLASLRNPNDIIWQVDGFSWIKENFQDAEFECSIEAFDNDSKSPVGKLSF